MIEAIKSFFSRIHNTLSRTATSWLDTIQDNAAVDPGENEDGSDKHRTFVQWTAHLFAKMPMRAQVWMLMVGSFFVQPMTLVFGAAAAGLAVPIVGMFLIVEAVLYTVTNYGLYAMRIEVTGGSRVVYLAALTAVSVCAACGLPLAIYATAGIVYASILAIAARTFLVNWGAINPMREALEAVKLASTGITE